MKLGVRQGDRAAIRRTGALATLLCLLLAAALAAGLGTSSADTAASLTQGPEAKLTAPAGEESVDGLAGFSVAMSGDGQTALVGAPGDDGYAGAAWVLVRSGTAWVPQGPKLAAGEAGSGGESCEEEPSGTSSEEGPECGFGRALAISADGNTALIGAPRQDEQQGAAWVFTRSEGKWSRVAELTGAGETLKGRFGRAVALSADGATALVSAPGDEDGRGRVWVFTRSGNSWSPQDESFAGAGLLGEAHFGGSVALAGDGDTALIGAPGDSDHLGAAWVFKRTGSSWSEQGAKLTGAGASSESRFGASVALSADASTALIGARSQNDGTGAAWVFTTTSGAWSEQGPPLSAGAESNSEFGFSVALSADGSSALIGAPRVTGERGSAWLFHRSGEAWDSSPEHLEGGAPESGKGLLGSSVSLSSNARELLLGAPGDHGKAGAAFAFGPSPSVVAVSPDEGPTVGGTSVTINGANLGEASAVRFGTTEATSFTVDSPSTITAISPPGHKSVDVTIRSSYGTSLVTTLDRFKYLTAAGESVSTASTTGGSTGTIGVLGFASSSAGGCGVALLSRKLAVAHARAVVRLRGSGAAKCVGKLRLRIRLRGQGRTTLKTIGTAVYSVYPSRTVVVRVKLNVTGRAHLRMGHERLNASLLLVRSVPAPVQNRTASVRLTRAKLGKVALPKR